MMISITNESKFFQDIYAGNYQAVVDELNKFPMMLEMISSPACLLATPILVAANSGQVAIFELLKRKGANLARLDALGNNLLIHAVASNNDEMIAKVMACYDTAGLAKALTHQSGSGKNVIDFALHFFPSKVDLLLGKRLPILSKVLSLSTDCISTNDLPTGSATRKSATELRNSSQLRESDDNFQEFVNALKSCTDSIPTPADDDFNKFVKQLSVVLLDDEPELVEIMKERDSLKKQGLNHKRTHEADPQQKPGAKCRVVPLSHPILIGLRNHTKLSERIQAKVEQAAKPAAKSKGDQFRTTPG